VYRAPFTARRRAEESRLFDRNRRLYQDRHCGARLRGEKKDYRTHCRGDACPNFAPADRIVIARPLKLDAPAPARTFRVEDDPLVTCIMPTRNRREFISDAIENFLRQDYAKRELVIVDDGEDAVQDLVPADPRIRCTRVSGPQTVGAKRNLACELARGEIIAHCDDDDWYPSWRLTAQVRALRRSGADLCGTSTLYFLDRERQSAWHYCYRSATPWLAGATLAYTREFWSRNRFTARNVGEDSELLWRHVPKRIHDLADPRLCIASIHAGNTGPHDTAGAFWHTHSIDELQRLQLEDEVVPLVSCIMPTFNRRAFVPRALELYAAQDHSRRELVIVDDGDDAIGDLVTGMNGVRYIRLESRRTIGGKRNIACARARGAIIAHWDDDDWYGPSRLSAQIAPILDDRADITGLAATCVHDSASGEFWTITRDLHRRAFAGDVHGGTLVYRRSILRDGLAYPEVNLAEDAWLLRTATARGHRLLRIENDTLFVYTRHTTNAWREFVPGSIDAAGWNPTDPPSGFVSARI
jgi:glycosyltransferase involved in cell wall biosynthesis